MLQQGASINSLCGTFTLLIHNADLLCISCPNRMTIVSIPGTTLLSYKAWPELGILEERNLNAKIAILLITNRSTSSTNSYHHSSASMV
jgi:hypothetical protein